MSDFDPKPVELRLLCRVCGDLTPVVVNIDFKATPVCNNCCLQITQQTVRSLTVRSLEVPFE